MPERESLYRVLQVDPAASPLVIQAAYRVLARIFHPDLEGDDDEMKRINHAWAILGDARLRAEYDRQVAGRHPGPAGVGTSARAAASPPAGASSTRQQASAHAAYQGGFSTSSASAGAAASPRPAPARQDDHAGPPQGEATGPMLTFGRYEGWTLGQVARADPPFLEWLRRVPAGRQYKDAIDVALRRADGARRMGIPDTAPANNDRPVHSWMPGAPTKVR